MITNLKTYNPTGYYSTQEAARVAQVPVWKLYSWQSNGIILPSVKWTDEFKKEHLGHSFESVVFIRLLQMLRDKGISLYNAVTALKILKDRFGYPGKHWAEIKIFADGKDVYVYRENDAYGTTVATRGHQKVAEVILGEEFMGLRDRTDALLIPRQFMDSVEIDPSIQNGLPIILDTKMLTRVIHNLKKQNYDYSEIQEMYPFIQYEKIVGAEGYEALLDRVNLN
ncbi:MAG: hypothetical protein JXA79_07295 [Deltaproteobacteria bacterium]|nr:hypothetical protein [Deltaproteobacteria bacterium]